MLLTHDMSTACFLLGGKDRVCQGLGSQMRNLSVSIDII